MGGLRRLGRGRLCFLVLLVCCSVLVAEVGRGELAGRTCLHGQETGPGIVGGRVTETGDEAEDETEDVCVSGRDGLRPERSPGRRLFLAVGPCWVRGQEMIAITVDGLEVAIVGFDVDRRCHFFFLYHESCAVASEC